MIKRLRKEYELVFFLINRLSEQFNDCHKCHSKGVVTFPVVIRNFKVEFQSLQ